MITVGVGDLKFGNLSDEALITYALGSCVGISAYNPILKRGAMLHAMLPSAAEYKDKSAENPFMFVDSGLNALFSKLCQSESEKRKLIICAAGGSSPNAREKEDFFKIGMRNITILRKILWSSSISLKGSDFGGYEARTMVLNLGNGEVTIKMNGIEKKLFAGLNEGVNSFS